VVWTREEDIQHDVYRPAYRDRLAATLSGGKIVGWRHRITGSSIMARWYPAVFQKGIDIDAVDSAVDVPYDIPNLQIEYVRAEPPGVPTGFWRGVGPNNNVFAIESFVDELAKKAGKDPVAFRHALLGKTPRLKAALERVASKAGWGEPLPARNGGRTGRGVGVQGAFGSYIATVAEVEVDAAGEVHVHRIVSAVDTGIVVNPDTVVAQLQGGLIFGVTAALYGEITIDKGRVQQSNFHDYRMLRIDQTPVIEVYLIPSGEAPVALARPERLPVLRRLRNAIFAATGIALRRLPIDRDVLAGRNLLLADVWAGKQTAPGDTMMRFFERGAVARPLLIGIAVVLLIVVAFGLWLVLGAWTDGFRRRQARVFVEYLWCGPYGRTHGPSGRESHRAWPISDPCG